MGKISLNSGPVLIDSVQAPILFYTRERKRLHYAPGSGKLLRSELK